MTSYIACTCTPFHNIYIEHTTWFKFKTPVNVITKEGLLSKKWKSKSCLNVELWEMESMLHTI